MRGRKNRTQPLSSAYKIFSYFKNRLENLKFKIDTLFGWNYNDCNETREKLKIFYSFSSFNAIRFNFVRRK